MITKNGKYPHKVADPQKRARLLAALNIAQEQYGWLSSEAICRVAQRLELSPGQVRSTVSFYSMFKLEPRGKYHVQVCEGLSCYLVESADPIIDQVCGILNIKAGETTQDGKFSLEIVRCFASCGTAPALRINDELFEQMTPESIAELLQNLKADFLPQGGFPPICRERR